MQMYNSLLFKLEVFYLHCILYFMYEKNNLEIK